MGTAIKMHLLIFYALSSSKPWTLALHMHPLSGVWQDDVLRQNITDLETGTHTIRVNAEAISPGVYFVLLDNKGKTSRSAKVVKL